MEKDRSKVRVILGSIGRSSNGKVFTKITDPNGGEVRIMNRQVFDRAASHAGRILNSPNKGGSKQHQS